MSQYQDWHENKDWVMADDVLAERMICMLSEESKSRWLRWNCMPSPEQCDQIEALRIRVVKQNTQPKPISLKRLTKLRYLSMPLDYATTLSLDWLPPSVETLSFDEGGTSESKRVIPKETVLPSVRRLQCVNGTLAFAKDSFPGLSSISLRLDSKRNMVRELLKYTRLSHIHVGPTHTFEDLQELSLLHPQYLGLFKGRLVSLDALINFPSIERLWLHSLNNLTDISAVAEMSSLRSIEMLYCPSVIDLRPLLSCRRLEHLSVIQCKGIELASVVDDLIKTNLVHLSITGTKYLYREDGRWFTNIR